MIKRGFLSRVVNLRGVMVSRFDPVNARIHAEHGKACQTYHHRCPYLPLPGAAPKPRRAVHMRESSKYDKGHGRLPCYDNVGVAIKRTAPGVSYRCRCNELNSKIILIIP